MLSVSFWKHKVLRQRGSKGLVALEVNYLLCQLALGMVTGFGVLFIFQLADGLIKGLMYVTGFYLLQRLVVAVVLPMVGSSIGRIGYRRVMSLALMSMAARLVFMTLATPTKLWPLVPALVLGGIWLAAYYVGFHGLFLDDNDDEKIGEQIGVVGVLGRMGAILSPFLAGVLVAKYGFGVMFSVAVGLLLVSAVPLLLMPHHKHKKGGFTMKKVGELLRDNSWFSASVFWVNVQDAIQVFFWPIFMYLILNDYEVFGIVGSGVMAVNGAAVYLAGKVYDKRSMKKGFVGATSLVAVAWVVRFMTSTPLAVATADGLKRLFGPLWWMKIQRYALRLGEKHDSLVYGVAWEYMVTAGMMLGLIAGLALLWMSGGNWGWLVIPAVLGTVMGAVAVRKKL